MCLLLGRPALLAVTAPAHRCTEGKVTSLAALSVPHPQAFIRALITGSQAVRSTGTGPCRSACASRPGRSGCRRCSPGVTAIGSSRGPRPNCAGTTSPGPIASPNGAAHAHRPRRRRSACHRAAAGAVFRHAPVSRPGPGAEGGQIAGVITEITDRTKGAARFRMTVSLVRPDRWKAVPTCDRGA